MKKEYVLYTHKYSFILEKCVYFMYENDGFYVKSLETKIEFPTLKRHMNSVHIISRTLLVSWKDYVHWSKSNCVRKDTCCMHVRVAIVILCVHRESGHVNFLEKYNLLKDCLVRWVLLTSWFWCIKGKLSFCILIFMHKDGYL